MKTTKSSAMTKDLHSRVGAANCHRAETRANRTVTKWLGVSAVLMVASLAGAANVPSGLTGLWRFENSGTNLGAATIGKDIKFVSNGAYAFYASRALVPWVDIGIDSWHTKFSDGYGFQEQSWNYVEVDPGFTANGGGSYVNEYTIAIDYRGDSGLNSIFQTSWNGNATDGDLWIDGTIFTNATIGVDAVGFSTMTFDASKWHRIVWSVANGNFFRVYIDGTNYLDGAGQTVDGRFSLYPDRFNLFADDSWQDKWGYVGTVATWNRALSAAEIADLGGWLGTNDSPTPLLFSDEAPSLIAVSPADGETNVAPGFAYQATIRDLVGLLDTNSIQLLLDGAVVEPVITARPAMKFITFSAGGLLQSGSTHKYTLIAGGSGVFTTNEVTFRVQNYTSYEWRFTNGDLGAALGNGAMTYADPLGTAMLTSFGTTDGSTVPHIAGNPAKFMHVPAFTLDTDGYLLTFDGSAPNVGSAYLNRYTLLMDVLVPSPWNQPYLVPFFNTGPYNLDDGDFYLTGAGELGIGAGGYSVTNTVTADTWYRIAFVADLKANTLTYYVNGTKVWSRAADGLDGRWALFSNQAAGPDLLLFNEPTGTSTHELYVSSIAFADRVLSAGEIAALGAPSAAGILVGNFAPRPGLTILPLSGGATVSWATNYVGYALEQTDSLTPPQWKPASGVTNNAVTISAAGAGKFYRLVQSQ